MDLRQRRYTEGPLVKTKIIATIGPACGEPARLRQLVEAGVDIFRLNFAHATHEWLTAIVDAIRAVSRDLARPIGLLADLSGPKIRLGELPPEGLLCSENDLVEFVRTPDPANPRKLTSTYDHLIEDVKPGDRVLLADGIVSLRVLEKPDNGSRVVCQVEQAGTIRSRQGINLPGVALSTPSLTEKDLVDLTWAIRNKIDFVGLSFVRKASDIRQLRQEIANRDPGSETQIVAKIEKVEAIAELEEILEETDAVMVARGDLGVEADVTRVPTLQKRIIKLCNQRRIPVITATQMLDSMQRSELPTRAEASDVANAVLDGSDAIMLSGETAIGQYPLLAVTMMSRIASEAEKLVTSQESDQTKGTARTRALLVTEAVTHGAGMAAELLKADLMVVASRSGRTAMAISKQRHSVPTLALTDQPATARRMCLYWGVTPLETSIVAETPQEILKFVVDWGKKSGVLRSGSRVVLIAKTNWAADGHDMMLVHALP